MIQTERCVVPASVVVGEIPSGVPVCSDLGRVRGLADVRGVVVGSVVVWQEVGSLVLGPRAIVGVGVVGVDAGCSRLNWTAFWW